MSMITRHFSWILFGILILTAGSPRPPVLATPPPDPGTSPEFPGKTQPAPGHLAAIAPQTTQPVKEVRVSVGDVVRKDQILFVQDDDEDRAEVEAAEAAVAAARASLERLRAQLHGTKKDDALADLHKAQVEKENARKYQERVEEVSRHGSVSEKTLLRARADYKKAVENERAAAGKLDAIIGPPMRHQLDEAEAELRRAGAQAQKARAALDNETVRARVAGTVIRLRAVPGLVGRPGLARWGEIVDTSVLEVRCTVPPAQARKLRVGQAATVRGPAEVRLRGKVTMISPAADEKTGRVPVRVRLDNSGHELAAYVAVQVSFANEPR